MKVVVKQKTGLTAINKGMVRRRRLLQSAGADLGVAGGSLEFFDKKLYDMYNNFFKSI